MKFLKELIQENATDDMSDEEVGRLSAIRMEMENHLNGRGSRTGKDDAMEAIHQVLDREFPAEFTQYIIPEIKLKFDFGSYKLEKERG